jgi:hypothetical protein
MAVLLIGAAVALAASGYADGHRFWSNVGEDTISFRYGDAPIWPPEGGESDQSFSHPFGSESPFPWAQLNGDQEQPEGAFTGIEDSEGVETAPYPSLGPPKKSPPVDNREILRVWLQDNLWSFPPDELIETDGDCAPDTTFRGVLNEVIDILSDPGSSKSELEQGRLLTEAVADQADGNPDCPDQETVDPEEEA